MPRYCSLFGGDDGGHREKVDSGYKGTYLNDLWELDLPSGSWRQLNPGVRGVKNGPTQGYAHHSAVVINGKMVTFGGLRRDDIWAYDASANTWSKLIPNAGPTPGKRHGHAAAEDPTGTGFYVFGGCE